jgi:hypothetical protein
LDTQQYGDYVWSFARSPEQGMTFDAAQQLVFARGHQLMSALLEGYPELSLLFTLATSDVFREVCLAGVALEQSDYALLPAFLDGMHAARDEARSAANLIDGFLPAYATREPAAYRLYHDLIHGDWPGLQAHWRPGIVTYRWATGAPDQSAGESAWPDEPALLCSDTERLLLTRDVTASFAVMLDYPSPGRPTLPFRTEQEGFGENLHTPEEYTALLRSALQASDRYVWSWTSALLWWPKPGDDRPLVPAAYVQAARVAREQARLESP